MLMLIRKAIGHSKGCAKCGICQKVCIISGSTWWKLIKSLAYNSGSHMMRLCRMDGNSIVSCKDEVGSDRKLKKFDWKEEQQLPSGWSCKISRRLKRADWKEGQEFLAGWSFRDI